MRVPKAMVWLGVVILVACQDGAGPAAPERARTVPDGALRTLRWKGEPTLSAQGSVEFAARPAAVGPAGALEVYAVSFWAHADRDNVVQVDYETDSEVARQYLRLTIPAQSLRQLADGSVLGASDSVLITVEVNRETLHVDLGPSGLQFQEHVPATLLVWYGGADPDFNGDGLVNIVDRTIEVEELGLWMQIGAGLPWERLTALHSVDAKWFSAELHHFSGYEVSY